MDPKLASILNILNLAVKLEPPVLTFFEGLFSKAVETGDQFLADADSLWAQVKANAQAQLNPPTAPKSK